MEFVAHADERELGDVGGAAGAVAFSEIIMRCKRLSAAANDFEEYVRKLSALSRQPAVQAFEDIVELHLLNVLRRVDAESGHAEAGEREQVVGDLLADGGEAGVQVRQR